MTTMSSQTTVYPVLSYVIVCEAALHNCRHSLNNKTTEANTTNNNNNKSKKHANAKHNEDQLSNRQQYSCDVTCEHSLIAQLTPLYCASAPYGHVNMYNDSTSTNGNEWDHETHEECEDNCKCGDCEECESHMRCVIDENAALRGVLEGFAGSVLSLEEQYHHNKIIYSEQVEHWERVYKEYATFTAEGEIKMERLLSPIAAEGVYIQVPSTEYIRRCHRQVSDASAGQQKNSYNQKQVITTPFEFANEFTEQHSSSQDNIVDDNNNIKSLSNNPTKHTKFSETSTNLPNMGELYGYAYCPRGTQILCSKESKYNNNSNEKSNAVSPTLMIIILSHSPCFNFMRRCAVEAINMMRDVYVLMCSDAICKKHKQEESSIKMNAIYNDNTCTTSKSCGISPNKRRSILANLIAEKLSFMESYVNVCSDVNTHALPGQLLPTLQNHQKMRETVVTTSQSTPSSTANLTHERATSNITNWCQIKQKLKKPLDVLYPYAEVPLPVLLFSFPFSAIRIFQTLLFFSLDSNTIINGKGNVGVSNVVKLFVIGASAQHASACVVALPALLTPLPFCGTVIPFVSPRVAVQSGFLEFMCYHDNNSSCLVGSTPELIPHLQLLSNLPCSYDQNSCKQQTTKSNNTSIWIADARTGFVGRVPFCSEKTNKQVISSEDLSSTTINDTSAALPANNVISLETCKLLPLVPYDGRLRRRLKRVVNKKQLSTFRFAMSSHTRQEDRYDRCAQRIKEATCYYRKNSKEFAYYSSPTMSSSHSYSQEKHHKHHRKHASVVNSHSDDDQVETHRKTKCATPYSSSPSSSTPSSLKANPFSEDFISNNCNNSHSIEMSSSTSSSLESSMSSSLSSSSSELFATSSDNESSSYDSKGLFTASVIDVIDMNEQETEQRQMQKFETPRLETKNQIESTERKQVVASDKVKNANMTIGNKTNRISNNNNNNGEEWSSSLFSYTGCYCLEYVHGALLAANTRWLLGNYRLPLMVAGMNVEKSLEEYIHQHNMLPLLRAMTNKNNVPASLLGVIGTSYAIYVFFQALTYAEKEKLSVFLQNVTFTSTSANTISDNVYLSHPSFRSLLQLFFVHASRCFPTFFAEIAHINGVVQCEQITRRVLTLHQHIQKQHERHTNEIKREKYSNSYSVLNYSTNNNRSTSTLMTLTLTAIALGKVKHNKKSMAINSNTMSGNDKQEINAITTANYYYNDNNNNVPNRKANLDNENYQIKDGKQKKKGVKGFFAAAKKMVKSTFTTGKNGEGSAMYCNSKKNQKAYSAVIDNFLQLRSSSRTLPYAPNYQKHLYKFDEVEREGKSSLQRIKCTSITLADLIASSKQSTQVRVPSVTAVTSGKYKNNKLQLKLLPLDVIYQFADYHLLLAPALRKKKEIDVKLAGANTYNAKDDNEELRKKLFLSLCFNLPHNANMWHRANDIFTSQIINATTTSAAATTKDISSNIVESGKRKEHEEQNIEDVKDLQYFARSFTKGANSHISDNIANNNNSIDTDIGTENVELTNQNVINKHNTSNAITLDELFAPISRINNRNANTTNNNYNKDHIEPSAFIYSGSNIPAFYFPVEQHQMLVDSTPDEQVCTLTEWGNFTSGAPDDYVAETPALMWSAITPSTTIQSNPIVAPQQHQQQQQQSGASNGTDLLDELFGSTSERSESRENKYRL